MSDIFSSDTFAKFLIYLKENNKKGIFLCFPAWSPECCVILCELSEF